MTGLRRQQLLILAGMTGAAVLVLVAWQASPWLTSGVSLPPDDPAARLAFAARWLLAPALCLLAGVGMTANQRFLSEEAIGGTDRPASRRLEINLRYNRNTLEQVVLASLAWLAAAVILDVAELRIIPVMAGLFVAGRIAFWLGYLYAPWARAFGFGLTIYPIVALMVVLLGAVISP